jgi:TRAP-type C4-dicarboxylate transport system permease small subunit
MIRRIHGIFLQFTLAISISAVSAIILFTLAELIFRSAGAPLYWSADLSSYALCIALSAGMPYVTREGAQIAVTLGQELAPPGMARLLQILVEVISALACAVICALCVTVALKQLKSGVNTVAVVDIPRWVLSAALAYGFAASGAMHLLNGVDKLVRRDATKPPVAGV